MTANENLINSISNDAIATVMGLLLMIRKISQESSYCQPWQIPVLPISCYSICCLIFNEYFSSYFYTSLKTPRITVPRCLQLLCCRTPEVPPNSLIFPLMPSGCKVRAKLPFFTIQAASNRIIHYQHFLTQLPEGALQIQTGINVQVCLLLSDTEEAV